MGEIAGSCHGSAPPPGAALESDDYGLRRPWLNPQIRDALWDGLPEIASPRAAGRFADDIYARARLGDTPDSRRAIILGDTHGVAGNFIVTSAFIRRAPREGIDRYLVECSPETGKTFLNLMPKVPRTIRGAGGLHAYVGTLPGDLTWGALPMLAMRKALEAGLKVGFIDAVSDDEAVRNRSMAEGIRRYADRGENTLILVGCTHVPAVHRAVEQPVPGRMTVNAISAQVVAPVSRSARNLVEFNLRNAPPAGRGFMFRLGPGLMAAEGPGRKA